MKKYINNQTILYCLKVRIQYLINKFKKSISGNNNLIQNKGILFNVKFDVIGNNNIIRIGKKTKLYNLTIFIRGDNHILSIEDNCIIKGGSLWFEDSSCKILIGKDTTIESVHLAVTENASTISIGSDCMFSDSIVLRTGDSHAIIDNDKDIKINAAQNISIGNHVWIGSRCTILKGVVVGNNAIIGTGSIVTKNVESNSVSVGIPSKVIKRNVRWTRNRFFQI